MNQCTLYTGCSYTHGTGLSLVNKDENLWVNILHKSNTLLNKTQKLNDSGGGWSNQRIFLRALHNILNHNVLYAFVQWSSYPRFEFEVGLETYNTHQVFTPTSVPYSHHLHGGITYSKKYLENIKNKLLFLMHDDFEIAKIVEYTNILLKVAKFNNTKIFFINGLCSWDNKFFKYTPNVLPNKHTEYTKQLIQVNSRSDFEIDEIYKKMHTRYKDLGGIHSKNWINLYTSLKSIMVDSNDDGLHPGIQSNKNTAKMINNFILNNV